jgi:crotonobetainyl-CoA:carnitine CoA-transferase CaiB-like acyl-CoA transferase
VDVNLLHSLLSALTNQAASTLATGSAPRRLGNAHPSISPYAVYRAADRDLVIAVGNDKQFAALAEVLGIPSLAADPRFRANADRVAHRNELTHELERALAGATAADWVDRLTRAGVPSGLVNDVGEAIALADRLGLEPVVALGASRTIASPIGLAATPAAYLTPPPRLDRDAGADWLPREDTP